MGNPSVEQLKAWQEAAQGKLIKLALAPEREGVAEFIQEATKQGVTIALVIPMPHMKKPWQQWKLGRPFGFTSTTGCVVLHTVSLVWLVQPLILLRRLVN